MDELVGVLKRELDEFMATYASQVLASMSDEEGHQTYPVDVDRIGKMWALMGKRNLSATVETLFQWQSARLDGSVTGLVGLWLSGKVLATVLASQPQDKATLDTPIATKIVDAVFNILTTWNRIECSGSTDTRLFSFRGIATRPTNDFLLHKAVHEIWRENLGLLGVFAIKQIKAHALKALEDSQDISKECAISNFATIRLCLLRPGVGFDEQAQASTSFLRVLVSCTHKAQSLSVRLSALQAVGAILTQHLASLSKSYLSAYHNIQNAQDWTSMVADLHTATVKLSAKKRYGPLAWQVRLSVLMLSPHAFFVQHWKNDALELLDAFGRNNGSLPFLHLIEVLLRPLVKRHIATSRTVPSDKDMMEVINRIQACCFTNAKHKTKKMRVIFDVLTKLTLALAAYNVEYTVKCHLQSLLAESDGGFQVRQLVGLLSMKAIFQQTGVLPATEPLYMKIPQDAVETQAPLLGEWIAHVLTACSNYLNVPGRSTKATEFHQWIGMQCLEAAVACASCLFSHITLSVDETLAILTHSAVYDDVLLQGTAAATLQRVGVTREDFAVFRSIGLHLLRVESAHDAPRLLAVVNSIVRDPLLPLVPALHEELATLEALALFLLCQDGPQVRTGALQVLDAVRTVRLDRLASSTTNVMDIVTGIDNDLESILHLQDSERDEANKEGGIMAWLALQPANKEWLWSLSLATLFPRVSEVCQELIAQVWTCAMNALHQLEIGIPDTGGAVHQNALSQWRNLAILTCSTADISRLEPTTSLLQRLSRFLKSPVVDQQISASIALSTTHFSSHTVLLDVLSNVSSTAFSTDIGVGYRNHLEVHGAVVGSLARCFRSIVQHRVHVWPHESSRQQILAFISQILDALVAGTSMTPSWLWWSRCEFCSIIDAVVHQNNMMCLEEDADTQAIDTVTRERWFVSMNAWTDSAISQVPCAPTTLSSSLLPVNLDHGALWHRYKLTKLAYSAMAMLMIGPCINLEKCFEWIDVAFKQQAHDLQQSGASGLRLLLQSDPVAVLPISVAKCLHENESIASQYMSVIASIMRDLRGDVEACASLYELIVAAMIQVRFAQNSAAAYVLYVLSQDIEASVGTFQPLAKPSTRLVQQATTQIAVRWSNRSVEVVLSVLSFVSKCNQSCIQGHLLRLCVPWIHEFPIVDRSFLTVLFRVTHEHTSVPSMPLVWLTLARSREYRFLDAIVDFFTQLPTKEKLQTARTVLTWITPEVSDTREVLERLVSHVQRSTTFETSSMAVILLAGLASQLDDAVHVAVTHRAFSILYHNVHGAESPVDTFAGVEIDCIAILEAMVHQEIPNYDSLVGTLREYVWNSPSTVAHFNTLLQEYCKAMPNSKQMQWAAMSAASFEPSHFDAQFSLMLYRFLSPPFDGQVCAQLMGLLKNALDDSKLGSKFVLEYLVTLKSITKAMPPHKLVLYPQLIWAAVALVSHPHEPFHVPALHLVQELVSISSFHEPIVQDVLNSWRPAEWKTADTVTAILLAVCRHMTSEESEKIVQDIVVAILGVAKPTKMHCVICTATLLPVLSCTSNESTNLSLRRDLSFLWRMQQQKAIADTFLQSAGTPWKMSRPLGRLLVSALSSAEEEKAFFDVLLSILNGSCTYLWSPTLDIIHALVQAPPPSFWKRHATLLAALTRMLRSTSSNNASWPILVDLLSTLLPCP